MKKLVLLICLIIVTPVYGWMSTIIVGGGVPASSSCASDVLVVGEQVSGNTYAMVQDYILFSRYQATDSCTIDTLGVHFEDSGTAATPYRLAIYSDSSGSVGTLIQGSSEGTTSGDSTSEYGELPISDAVVTTSEYYWLAFWTGGDNSTDTYNNSNTSTSNNAYFSISYSSTGSWPTSPSVDYWNDSPGLYGLTK